MQYSSQLHFDGRRRVHRARSVRVGSVSMWVRTPERGREGTAGGAGYVGDTASAQSPHVLTEGPLLPLGVKGVKGAGGLRYRCWSIEGTGGSPLMKTLLRLARLPRRGFWIFLPRGRRDENSGFDYRLTIMLNRLVFQFLFLFRCVLIGEGGWTASGLFSWGQSNIDRGHNPDRAQ